MWLSYLCFLSFTSQNIFKVKQSNQVPVATEDLEISLSSVTQLFQLANDFYCHRMPAPSKLGMTACIYSADFIRYPPEQRDVHWMILL